MALSDQAIAERCAEIMQASDGAQQHLDIKLESVSPGFATVSMMVLPSHVNGHGICHGGFIYTLADCAFAYACNSRNQNTLAQHCSITYLAPGQLHEQLSATANEVSLMGRSGIYDVVVSNQDADVLAQFRGHSRTIAGSLFVE